MTRQKIDRIVSIQKELDLEKWNHRNKLRSLNDQLRIARKECDHTRSDGSSALVPSFILNYCEICFASEL